MILLAWLQLGYAEENNINADVKNFFIAGFPFEHLLMPEQPYAQSFLDTRLKLEAKLFPNVRLVAHHAVTLGTPQPTTKLSTELAALGQELDEELGGGFMTGVGLAAPELFSLSWRAFEEGDLFLQGRTDRLYVDISISNIELRIGRQPISFGYGLAFNPLDLIQPFGVATIDGEYKPGIDAVRGDVYLGMASQITVVAAYMGSWAQEDMIYAINGLTTVGMTECSLFAARVRGDTVLGLGATGSIGSVGVYGDGSFTFPAQTDTDPFLRIEMGALLRPFEDTTITAELYHQSNGAERVEDYLSFASEDPRFERGELWLMGQYYATLGLGQQLTPLLSANLATTANLIDQSAMINLGLSYSMSDNTTLVMGGFYGLGERPQEVTLTNLFSDPDALQLASEFGFYPSMFFMQLKSYL